MTSERQALEHALPHKTRDADLALVINALLFLANQDDVVSDAARQPARAAASPLREHRQRHPTHAPAAASRQRTLDLAAPEVLRVGERYEQDLVRYRRSFDPPTTGTAQDQDDFSATDGVRVRAVRPHLRAPHWHLYWTGVGRTHPRLKFIAPVYVGGGPPVTEDAPAPMVRKVR